MIIKVKQQASAKEIAHLTNWLERMKLRVQVTEGEFETILGVIGDTTQVDIHALEGLAVVDQVIRISEPFKAANRKFHPDNTTIKVGRELVGGGALTLIAGPCSVETEEQIVTVARRVKAAGATMLRGGAYKPRTSPYDFQGLQEEGIRLLQLARAETGLPIVTEIMNLNHIELFADVDVIQVGARNMQNFDLLRELGRTRQPILLKRGLASTLKEFLMSAEYVMSGGNPNVILCERGIRTFETFTRNTFDVAAVPVLQELTHLPVFVDPSHAVGIARFVPSLALAGVAAGADGLLIEVHNNPERAWSDGAQSLRPEAFAALVPRLLRLREALQP